MAYERGVDTSESAACQQHGLGQRCRQGRGLLSGDGSRHSAGCPQYMKATTGVSISSDKMLSESGMAKPDPAFG